MMNSFAYYLSRLHFSIPKLHTKLASISALFPLSSIHII